MIHLRATGWPVELIGFGDSETGMCSVRVLGEFGGQEYDQVHYSQLNGPGSEIKRAFYGPTVYRGMLGQANADPWNIGRVLDPEHDRG